MTLDLPALSKPMTKMFACFFLSLRNERNLSKSPIFSERECCLYVVMATDHAPLECCHIAFFMRSDLNAARGACGHERANRGGEGA